MPQYKRKRNGTKRKSTRSRRLRTRRFRRRARIHYFKRSLYLSTISTSSSADVVGAVQFSLDTLADYTEFTNLFDQYAITKVVVKFIRIAQAPTYGGNSVDYSGAALFCVDTTDFSTPTQSKELLENETCRIQPHGQNFKMVIRPQGQIAAYNGSGFGAYKAAAPGSWCDTRSPDIKHWGFKYFLPIHSGSVVLPGWQMWCTYYFKCKQVI